MVLFDEGIRVTYELEWVVHTGTRGIQDDSRDIEGDHIDSLIKTKCKNASVEVKFNIQKLRYLLILKEVADHDCTTAGHTVYPVTGHV